MSSLRVGGLAIIIKAYTDPSLVGRVVEIYGRADGRGLFKSPATGLYRFTLHPGAYICTGDFHSGSDVKEEDGFGLFSREQLMPIDGEDFSHEGEHEKELTHG
ncbi:hypothetical protein [Cedecea sp. NFIX57]|uniref:hypothetical protein n=1 Tax=Cedecea sp. NFIX57 TaxID=1566286 RepID=UPI000A0E0E0A|nr:hypothetical protein [Cedecea sp. NFIX57]SMG61741.1 hypothetical protein SAMN03159353_10577 [Cedecea sp. NFIX57]